MTEPGLIVKHHGRTVLMFGVRFVSLKSAANASGPDDVFLEVLASGTKMDTHVERMSEEILNFMLGEAKKGKVILVENHSSSLRMGLSVDGRIVKNSNGELELYQTFKLDPNSSSARDLVAQMADPVNPYVPDCSVGLLNVAVEEMYDDDAGEHYKILLPIPETIYEHLALTRPDGQAYPDAALVAVGGKNALREITAKSLTAALDCVMINSGKNSPDENSQEPDDMNAKYRQLLKARAAIVRAAVSKIGDDVNKIPAPPPGFGGPPVVPPGGPGGIASPGDPGEVTPSGSPTTTASPAFPMPDEKNKLAPGDAIPPDASLKNKLEPADAIPDDPTLRLAKIKGEMDLCRSKITQLEASATKDEPAITTAKAALKAMETECAKIAQPDPNALAANKEGEVDAAKLAAAKVKADEMEAKAKAEGMAPEMGKADDAMMGYGTIDGARDNVKGMREMVKAFREDDSVSPEQWGELASHLHDELEMLETGLTTLAGGDNGGGIEVSKSARRGAGVNLQQEQSTAQVMKELASLRAQVQKLGETGVQRVPARLNDPSQLPDAERATLSVREQLMKIKDPAERERASFDLVGRLNASLRNTDELA